MSKRPIDLLLNDICQSIDRIEQYIKNLPELKQKLTQIMSDEGGS